MQTKKHYDYQLLQQKKDQFKPCKVPGSRALNSGSPLGQTTQSSSQSDREPKLAQASQLHDF